MNLRHVPLLLVASIPSVPGLAKALPEIIRRPDEITELLSIYWKDGRKPLTAQLKKGLAKSFNNFNRYQLAKYQGTSNVVKLRDAMSIVHPKPKDAEQVQDFKDLADGKLKQFDTWENELSAGGDKKEVFARLLEQNKLGYMALLRNMIDSGVNRELISKALLTGNSDKVLPFRFLAAMQQAPSMCEEINQAWLRKTTHKFDGNTIILVDVSASMEDRLSVKSDLVRMDVASCLALVFNGNKRIFSFSDKIAECVSTNSLLAIDSIKYSQPNYATDLTNALNHLYDDRIIVITDEQVSGSIPEAKVDKAYMINVASYENGIGYSRGWKSITGFSENIFNYIKVSKINDYLSEKI